MSPGPESGEYARAMLAYRPLEDAARAIVGEWWNDEDTDIDLDVLATLVERLRDALVTLDAVALRQSEARTERNLRASGPSVGPSRFS